MNFLKDLFGLAKKKKGDFEGSIADHTKAIELKPDLAAAYNNRGNAKRAKGDLNGAIADYNKAIQLQPDYEDDYDSIKALIASGADVNARSKVGRTSLMWAADKGDADSIEALIASGADVNAKDENGKTALMKAVKSGKADCVEALIAAGAEVNARSKAGRNAGWKEGRTALMEAASNSAYSVKALIAAGADVNAKDNGGETALMAAVTSGKAHCVEALIAAGAHVNAKDENGTTALMEIARTFDDHDSRTSHVIVEALIAAGADVNARDNGGATALEIATSVNGFRGGDHSFECILARCFASILSGRSPFASGCAKAFLASPLFKPALTHRLSAGSCSHSSMNRVRSMRPNSRKARARPF